ncbi:glutamate-5-semialdehyde dehydrogenase [Lujinxingia litoralis]|uniref:Gamma-glutamyl phosphate reductase n=1 Tax=Lujinxingia litoralis TaxID=2211119 RepID=A0A328CBM7_9DELT|nr:glutamate-5-semialdehyde dehydrogenase [Lujinxingia litoralis]RAL25448.1 glutamate-5-semialdehyde dehydrogenase [Lujinxingia litoralis]
MKETFDPQLLTEQARGVRRAARQLARQPGSVRDDALQHMAQSLRAHTEAILQANQADLARARHNDLSDAFIDRLRLTPERIEQMAAAIDEVRALADPVGGYDEMWMRPNGLQVARKRIPLGVIGIIYEARPNVTSDAAALCLKSGNGVMLKGGSDAYASNLAVVTAMRQGLRASALPEDACQAIGFVESRAREATTHLLTLSEAIDVIIPRGGKGLIHFVHQHSRIPVIKHDEGVCHLVVDGSADVEVVERVVLNAKTQRPGVCNAAETLLFTRNALGVHVERCLKALARAGVKLHLCETSAAIAESLDIAYTPATDQAYATEFLSLELSVKVVDDLEAAIAHIDRFGSRHSEALLTENYPQTQRFIDAVDSSVVLINASTRFSDGGQLGLGAEIGISTTRMHAYGPMGLKELTTTKFVVLGTGQIRE